MKYFFIFLVSSLILFSCNGAVDKKSIKDKMNWSFKTYIKNNDKTKGLVTDLKRVDVVSYTELDGENANEKYEAKIYMLGTTAYTHSSRVYNMSDTVTCYFDAGFKMTRLVNPNDK